MENIKGAVEYLMQNLRQKKNRSPIDSPECLMQKILSKKEARHVRARFVKQGKLFVDVDSSGWLYHFGIHKEDLLSRLKKESPGIKDIRFRIGEIAR